MNPSGDLVVVDVFTRQILRRIPLGGQPDSIAVSPDGRYAVIAIENERDEDLGSGEPPQAPPGFLVIVDLVGSVDSWATRTVDLDGVDTDENDLIEQIASLGQVPREPDAIAWTGGLTFATADEGDLFGGSRGFTTWSVFGLPQFGPGAAVDRTVARLGHYPEDRSENKGSEPEGIEFGQYGAERLLFVGVERANAVLVYELLEAPILGVSMPVLRQVLPTGVAPEGLLAIPERGLFVVACEEDDRDDKIRSTVMIYTLGDELGYPTISSDDREGTDQPIPWGALSALATGVDGALYAAHDSFYRRSRIYTLDGSLEPAVITDELELRDADGVLANALATLEAHLPGSAKDDFDPTAIVEADGAVNLDLEGLAAAPGGGFWAASEGTGNLVAGVSDPNDRPFESPNLLVEVAADGTITDAVLPPLALTLEQFRFGFEGVALANGALWVAFQRAWQGTGDPSDRVRIGRYDLTARTWDFAHYPLDAPTSPLGGWVGLSELTALGGGEFAVIERDNQGGPDAALERVYRIDTTGVTFAPDGASGGFPLLTKTLVSDLLVDGLFESSRGPIPEKLEGLTTLADGSFLIVNDNDGVDDNNGETLLLRFDAPRR